ncbi:Pc12g01250, partial [Penicillium rubens Wisconsin 54-1255]
MASNIYPIRPESRAGFGLRKLPLRLMKRDILCSLAVWIILKLRQGISRYGIRVWGGGRLFRVAEAKL